MSDSASNKGVEDVLTSVRRLVSNDVPRNRRPDPPAGPGALVLTDAQRVERPVSKGSAAKSLEDRIAELEAAVSTQTDEYEPDGSEDQAQHQPDRIVYTRPPSDAEQAAMRGETLRLSGLSVAEHGDDETAGETGHTAPVAFRHRGAAQEDTPSDQTEIAEEAPMAEDVAPPPQPSAEVRPFHDPDDMLDRFEARIEDAEASPPGPGHNGFSERLEPYNPENDQEAVDALAERVETEAVEQAFAQISELDGGALDSPVEDAEFEASLSAAVSTSQAVELADETPAQEKGPEKTAPAERAAEGLAAGALDDELLKPIVAQLIRQELQGELGERITRNVRKLVRREIHRALTSREFE